MMRRCAIARLSCVSRVHLPSKPRMILCDGASKVAPSNFQSRHFSSHSFCTSAADAPIDVAIAGVLVKVDMKMSLLDGTVLDETPGVTFVCGAGQMLSGVDQVVLGMRVGETREATLQPVDAFGEQDPDALLQVPLSQLPPGSKAGDQLSTGDGGHAVIKRVEGDTATVDHNHPLAGTTVVFKAKLLKCSTLPELRHEVQIPGDGVTFPQKGNMLTMHYTGSLAATGKVFDSSRGREPFKFTIGIGQVISGWDQGIMHMSLGERSILRIPSGLAYGGSGAGDAVPPDADLVFDVELLKIN